MMHKLKDIARAIWRVILGDSFADDERLEELENVLALDMLDSDDHVSHDG